MDEELSGVPRNVSFGKRNWIGIFCLTFPMTLVVFRGLWEAQVIYLQSFTVY